MLWCLACILHSVSLIDEFVGDVWLLTECNVAALFQMRWQYCLREDLLVLVEKSLCCLLECIWKAIVDQVGWGSDAVECSHSWWDIVAVWLSVFVAESVLVWKLVASWFVGRGGWLEAENMCGVDSYIDWTRHRCFFLEETWQG